MQEHVKVSNLVSYIMLQRRTYVIAQWENKRISLAIRLLRGPGLIPGLAEYSEGFFPG